MAFPTSPSEGQEYTNALGTVYKYTNVGNDDKWYIITEELDHNNLNGLNDGDSYEHITQTQKDALHAIYTLEAHVLATSGPHTGTLPWGEVSKTSSSLADLATRNHADLLNKNAETDFKHLTDAQQSALHAIYTLETHATSHQNAGGDEINVGGLSGLLADAQTPLSHALDSHSVPIGSIAMSSQKFTGLGAGSVAGESVRYEQLHSETHVLALTGPHTTALPWSDLNKTGSSLADLATRTHASLSDQPTDAHHTEIHVLNTSGPHTGPLQLTDLGSWAAQGDLIFGGASDWSVLTKGTSGKYLKAGATTISWEDADATLIKGVTVDNTDIDNGKILKYNSSSGNLEYELDDTGAGFAPPIGFIAMFSGSWTDNSTIPGWYKCDGNNGTVNLVNKFVRGATTSGGTGGSDNAIVVTHNHPLGNQDTSHSHALTIYGKHSSSSNKAEGSAQVSSVGVQSTGSQSLSHSHTVNNSGASGTNKNIPAYYALIFIQRIS